MKNKAFTFVEMFIVVVIVAIIGGKEVYHRYLKDRFSIPEDK